jgi:hypothetical protein
MSQDNTSQTPQQAPSAPEEWKPEPRKWEWKDLFSAPMVAFKPKCMLVSAITVALLVVFFYGTSGLLSSIHNIGSNNDFLSGGDYKPVSDFARWGGPVLYSTVWWISLALAFAIFSTGAALVGIFMKADLLDDEFLSMSEALSQFVGRIKSVVMVPLFLVGILGGCTFVAWMLLFLGGIVPFAGPFLFALLYILAFLFGLFLVLLFIAVLLSSFVFPGIVAARKHGWFDNVIDTFEAVGTRPHLVVLNVILTLGMIIVALSIAFGAMNRISSLSHHAAPIFVYGRDANHKTLAEGIWTADQRGNDLLDKIILEPLGKYCPTGFLDTQPKRDMEFGNKFDKTEALVRTLVNAPDQHVMMNQEAYEPVTYWGSGLIVGIMKIILAVFIIGYAMNLFVAGGLLTWLTVREDDCWDDEELEDLDKLAKELEEEAKRDAEAETAKAAAGGAQAKA